MGANDGAAGTAARGRARPRAARRAPPRRARDPLRALRRRGGPARRARHRVRAARPARQPRLRGRPRPGAAGDGPARLRRQPGGCACPGRRARTPALWGRLRAAARRVGVGPRLPGHDHRHRPRRPHAVPARRAPRHRPHRLRLPLLPPHLRRRAPRLRPQPRCGRGRRCSSWCAGSRPGLRTLKAMATAPETLLLAAPRGYCAGVDRAVQTVERALELYGPPVYVRKEIVHNKHVVEQLRARGAIFVEELDDDIPEGAITVFSAHGVSPTVHAEAGRRNLQTIDATCPLVTKVHVRGQEVRGGGLHDRPHRPCRPRGGRGHDGGGARAHRAGGDRGRRRPPRGRGPRAHGLHLADHALGGRDRARSSTGCGRASRPSSVPAPTTSATPPPTARPPSSRWPATATWCW